MYAFSRDFRPILVEEACSDRGPQAHRANLFDTDVKFCDVEKLNNVLAELRARRRSGGGR